MCVCYVSYDEFKTGFTFKDIRKMLQIESNHAKDNNEIMYITRHTVLGRWREIKLQLYYQYYEQYQLYGCICSDTGGSDARVTAREMEKRKRACKRYSRKKAR